MSWICNGGVPGARAMRFSSAGVFGSSCGVSLTISFASSVSAKCAESRVPLLSVGVRQETQREALAPRQRPLQPAPGVLFFLPHIAHGHPV